ncbi:hypothetical protein BCR41DRAFT_56122 [Lobosporangium transversale]|uniref:Uncharacterized protein n=1 Tax=Lobosporangium transversale TaxID=64571 RepID=A0A1Y2GNM8_9FUNG|nr:hypothetical protein BCR41DRAFT_56122 [Lobosporangium transversale]ORZ16781.1 hypothetical protein BCR41DRAFT_56122 [Lobosporangium transversale]|eukprot:XP_021881716.1 hypothetical protein BCR41DRAFT_56122 [Lobosporangium transversale]
MSERNIFARTRSFLPRTLSIGSNKDVATTVAPTAPIRNETNIDMSGQQQPMTSVSSSQPLNSQSFAPLAHEKENVPVTPGTLTDSTPSGQAIPNESSRAPPSPAIERLLSMK